MKLLVIVFSILLAGAHSMPQEDAEMATRERQGRLIVDVIASVIERAVQILVDAGLDPLVVDRADLEYALPVPSIFNLRAYVSGLLFRGASNIIINDLTFNALALRATFNIGLPEILLNVVDSEVDANLFDQNINCRYSGRLVLQNIVTTGDIRINIGIISGISIRDLDLTVSFGKIDSQLNLSLQGVVLSDAVNTFLGKTIPATLEKFETDINSLLSIVAKDIFEGML